MHDSSFEVLFRILSSKILMWNVHMPESWASRLGGSTTYSDRMLCALWECLRIAWQDGGLVLGETSEAMPQDPTQEAPDAGPSGSGDAGAGPQSSIEDERPSGSADRRGDGKTATSEAKPQVKKKTVQFYTAGHVCPWQPLFSIRFYR